MRLTCPNCNAQYEVDASVIPDNGRDVQCSNCGHSWFQPGQATKGAEASAQNSLPKEAEWEGEAADTAPAEVADPQDAPAPDVAAAQPVAESPTPPAAEQVEPEKGEAEPEKDAVEPEEDAAEPEKSEVEPEKDAAETEKKDDDEDIEHMLSAMVSANREELSAAEAPKQDTPQEPPAAPAAPRRPQDDNLLSILREEAERESQARRAEGSALETQPDLGLDDAASGIAGAAAAGTAALGAKAAQADRAASDTPPLDEFEDEDIDDDIPEQAVRRRALPDIEEINSSLSATSDRGSEPAALDAPQTLARRRSGFRVGFTLMVVIAAIGLLVYTMAPSISSAVPALAPTLDAYVQKVDEGRVWLDQQMRDVIDALQDDSQV